MREDEMTTSKRHAPKPESPAKITPDMARDRAYVTEIPDGRKTKRVIASDKAWRRLSPLERVYAMSQLAGGDPRNTALQRYEAGKRYAETFATAQSSGRDSTQAMMVSRSTAASGLSQAQAQAIRDLVTVDGLMPTKDRLIVRAVCGDGEWPSAAVEKSCGPGYQRGAPARFREALDSLVDAIEAARRKPGTFHVRRETSEDN